jgi:hypothetical protein
MSALALVLLAGGLATAWTLSWPVAWAWDRLLRARPPAAALDTARWGLVTLLLPLLAGGLVALAAIGMTEHGFACHCGPEGGFHLCATHPGSAAPLVPLALGVLCVLGLPALRGLGRLIADVRAGAQLAARARAGSTGGDDLVLAPLGRRNAYSVGLLRPTIIADDAWWATLSEADRALVLAHERAHVLRRDALVLALARALAALQAPAARRTIAWWQAAAEHDADRHAASVVGDPLRVASFLVRALRAGHPAAPAFHGTAVERRIRALAECDVPDGPVEGDLDRTVSGALVSAIALATVGVFFGADLHRLVERILALLPALA